MCTKSATLLAIRLLTSMLCVMAKCLKREHEQRLEDRRGSARDELRETTRLE